MNRWGPLFARRGFQFTPSQEAVLSEMKLQTPDGRWFGGAEAWFFLWRTVWWLSPIADLLSLPGFHWITTKVYHWIAANRYCLGGRCRPPVRYPIDRWAPICLLPVLALAWRPALVPWMFMWAMAFAIYASCKWFTLRTAVAEGTHATRRDQIIYLLLWPGMSFHEFVGDADAQKSSLPNTFLIGEWLAAIIKTTIGACLLWQVVPAIDPQAWLIRGWFGMIGIILMLHFGSFHLLALLLQLFGYRARPNMNAPLKARSLADFWGRRWNTGFNTLADEYGFRLLKPWVGAHAAFLIVFFASGVIHEVVITLPAGGGYGLPTIYFAIQALGIFAERGRFFRKHPVIKRLMAWGFIVAPLPCLFPPVFVRNVILPMLHAIGAT